MSNLKTLLADWQDGDVAAYYLALTIGIFDDPDPWGGKKHILWTNNPLGNALYDMLVELANADVLEFDGDLVRYRWRA